MTTTPRPSTPRPRPTRQAELLESGPLPRRRGPMVRLVLMGIPCLAMVVIGFLMRPPDWTFSLAGVLIFAIVGGLCWVDLRAVIHPDGDQLHVRTLGRTHTIQADQLRRVTYQFNGRRPDYWLHTDEKKVLVPASKLRDGQAAVMAWVGRHAPRAEMDEKTQAWRRALVAEGLL